MPARSIIFALCTFMFIMAPNAKAHKGATGIVKERMDIMKMVGKETKLIAPMALGEAKVDFKTIEKSAMTISKAAKEVVQKFPKGSHTGITEAKPNIWENWAEFEELFNVMANEAADLAKIAQTSKMGELEDQFAKLVKNCKDCHKEFRIKKD